MVRPKGLVHIFSRWGCGNGAKFRLISIHIPFVMRLETRGTLPRPKNSPPDCFCPGFAGAGLSSPFRVKNKGEAEASPLFLVRRKGLEPPTY